MRHRAIFQERQDALDARLPPANTKLRSPNAVRLAYQLMCGFYRLRKYLQYFDEVIDELRSYEHLFDGLKTARAERQNLVRALEALQALDAQQSDQFIQ